MPGRGPVIEALFWAHGRRKFYELADIAANKRRGKRAPPISPLALEAVKRIDALFDIEREINGKPAERRLAVRREKSAPLVAELEDWMRMEACWAIAPGRRRQGHGLHAEALGQLRALPRRRPYLHDEQRRRASATRDRPRKTRLAVRRLRQRGRAGRCHVHAHRHRENSTTSIRKPASPMSSTVLPTCRRPVCKNPCHCPGRPTGNRPWPHNFRPLAARQLPTTTPLASRRSLKSWRIQPTGGAVFTGGVPLLGTLRAIRVGGAPGRPRLAGPPYAS